MSSAFGVCKSVVRNFRCCGGKVMICLCCKNKIHIHPFLLVGHPYPTEEEKKTPGIVYSDAGYNEIFLSGICESCFDKITKEDENEEEKED